MIWRILSFLVGIALIGAVIRIVLGFATFTIGWKIGWFVIAAALVIGLILLIRRAVAW